MLSNTFKSSERGKRERFESKYKFLKNKRKPYLIKDKKE